MKLTELLMNQSIIIQLIWGEKKIEITSQVIENDGAVVYVTPYVHNGSPLELNVTQDKGVICNLYADQPVTKKRMSWKNVELTTVKRGNKSVYCLRTYGFNNVGNHEDRRLHERVMIQVDGLVHDSQAEKSEPAVIRDISDIGISFYAPEGFSATSQQLSISFTDDIDGKDFNVKVECSAIRMSLVEGKTVVGCRIVGENRDYLLYGFMKRLREKSHSKTEED